MQNFIIIVKRKNALTAKGEFECVYKDKLFESEASATLEKEKAISQDKQKIVSWQDGQDADNYEYEIVPLWKPGKEPISVELMLLVEKQIKELIRLELDILYEKLNRLEKGD